LAVIGDQDATVEVIGASQRVQPVRLTVCIAVPRDWGVDASHQPFLLLSVLGLERAGVESAP
jgi:hypothetical protein